MVLRIHTGTIKTSLFWATFMNSFWNYIIKFENQKPKNKWFLSLYCNKRIINNCDWQLAYNCHFLLIAEPPPPLSRVLGTFAIQVRVAFISFRNWDERIAMLRLKHTPPCMYWCDQGLCCFFVNVCNESLYNFRFIFLKYTCVAYDPTTLCLRPASAIFWRHCVVLFFELHLTKKVKNPYWTESDNTWRQ